MSSYRRCSIHTLNCLSPNTLCKGEYPSTPTCCPELEQNPEFPRLGWRSTVSRLISDYQPLDQHLLTTLSAPFSRLISACQLLDQRLSAARSRSVNDLISTCQPLDQRLSATLSLPNQLRDQRLLSRLIRICQPVDQHLSAA